MTRFILLIGAAAIAGTAMAQPGLLGSEAVACAPGGGPAIKANIV